jgi:hypothetical protein
MHGFASLVGFGVAVSTASAQPKPTAPALVGLKEVARYTTPVGFIDDPVAADEHRIAYVVADAASKAELHVVTVGAGSAAAPSTGTAGAGASGAGASGASATGAPGGGANGAGVSGAGGGAGARGGAGAGGGAVASGAGASTGGSSGDQIADLSAVTLHPTALEFVGTRVFVVGANEDGSQMAALVDLADRGKSKPAGASGASVSVIYKLPAATHIAVITRDGKRVVAVHRQSPNHSGHRHEVELVSLETGRRIATGRALELEADGSSKALDFRINHWGDGMTRAFGIKGGEWNKKEDQRSPDVEASYDLITGKFADQHPIPDLFEQRKRYQILADAGGRIDFLRVAPDGNLVQVWQAAKPRAIELDQPLAAYDPKSLLGVVASDGSAWFAIKIDPVNPEAVARKKADPEYLDVFHVGTDTKAIRKARILAPKVRHWFGSITNNRFWLIERNTGFERGGRALAIYQLD